MLDDEIPATDGTASAALLGAMIGSDVVLRVDPTPNGVHGLEWRPIEATKHRRSGGLADAEAAVRQYHEQATRADEAGRLVEARREVVGPAPGMHLVADIGAATGGGAVGEQRVAQAPVLLDVEDETGPRLRASGVAILGQWEAERDDVARGDVVLPRRSHREVGLHAVEHCRCP